MTEGFVVMSRWGPKLHMINCPCGVCVSRRKQQHVNKVKQKAAEHEENGHSTTVLTPRQTNIVNQTLPSTNAAIDGPEDAQPLQAERQHGDLNRSAALAVESTPSLTVAPAASATADAPADTRSKPVDKALPKTRFSMELAALGTPDMPLNKVRVPRQAATAAKAAIKKDLLMQNSRPGAASVPSKTVPSSSAVKSASSKIQKKQARGLQPAPKASETLNGLSQDDADAIAHPPAGPTEDEIPAVVSGSDKLWSISAAADTEADAPAAPVASTTLPPAASPQPSSATHTQSHRSEKGPCPGTAVRDTLQSAELSDGPAAEPTHSAEDQDAAPPASPPPSPQSVIPHAEATELTPVEKFAQEVRSKAEWGPAVDVNVRGLMASGAMAGQPVHIQLKHKDPVYLQGVIQATGMVKCAQSVGGPVNHECSLSEYEKLGNSKERRPGENIHLTNFSLALKDFCALVNVIGEKARNRCLHCKQGSGLIRCKGCSVAAHPLCVDLSSRQQQANWFCASCKASGQDKLPQRPQDLQGRSRAPAHRPPSRPQSASAPARPPAAQAKPDAGKSRDTSCVSPAGRVHMAVPVSGMTPARRERNGNKHKRLFMGGPGGLQDGEPVEYRTAQQGLLLKGQVCIKPGLDAQAGILCHCCNQVVSCSKFEAHAGQGSRRAPYDNIFTAENITLRSRAAMLPPLAEGEVGFISARGSRRVSHSRSKGNAVHHTGQLGGIVDGCRDVIHDLDHDAGGCNICGRPDFALGTFCDRTMILCDQCECEFHVGCLRKAGRCDLSQLPTGDWFCSEECSGIWKALNGRVAAGPALLDSPDYTLQLTRGRDNSGTLAAQATNAAIDTAQQVLQESFDPIIDKATKENLLLLMTKAEVKGEYDYRGMYTALLTHQGRAVCAAVFRAFGAQLAEVPLVATKADARRHGHCRVLMSAFDVILKEAGVRTMCLPAAHETVHTWIHGFGLQPMPDDDLDAACKDLRLLIFPGTQVLQKQLLPPLPPKQGPLMTPPWAEEPAAPPTDGQTPADITASDPQQVVGAAAANAPLPVLEAQAAASAAATAVAGPNEMALRAEKSSQVATQLAEPATTAGGVVTEPPKTWPDPVAAAVDLAGDTVMAEVAQADTQSTAAVAHNNSQGPLEAMAAEPSQTPACSTAADGASESHSVPYEAAAQRQDSAVQPSFQIPASLDTDLYQEAETAAQDDAVMDRADIVGTTLQQQSCSQDTAAPVDNRLPAPSIQKPAPPEVQSSLHNPDQLQHTMVPPPRVTAGNQAQSSHAVQQEPTSPVSSHGMHLLSSVQAAPAQQPTLLASRSYSQHDTEAGQLHPGAVSDACAAADVVGGSQAPAAQPQTSLVVAGPAEQHAGLPVTQAAAPAAAVSSPSCSTGQSVGGHPSQLHGLAALAQQYQQKHRLAGGNQPVEYISYSALIDEQADSNMCHAEHSHNDGTLQQHSDSNSGRDAATAHCSQQGPGQSFGPSSWSAGHNATGFYAPSTHDVPSENGAQADIMSTQQASAATGPLSVTRKRHFDAKDGAAQDSILAKKQHLALSGVA